MKGLKLFLSMLILSILTFSAFAKTQVQKLVTEYLENPIGIDVSKPRFSWQIISDGQNVKQSAFEIRVADSPQNLNKKSALIWTSGKVESDKSVKVKYGGSPLKSMEKAYWQVRIWDNNNKVTDWSEPAFWEMGILESETWKANWIAFGNEIQKEGSKPGQYFRKDFQVKKKVKSARVYVTSLGLYQLYFNGKKVSDDLFTPGWTTYNKRLQYQTYNVTSMLNEKNSIGAS